MFAVSFARMWIRLRILPIVPIQSQQQRGEIRMSTFDNAVNRVSNMADNMETKARKGSSSEDRFTGAIEAQTSKVPSSTFLGLAIGSMAASFTLKLMGKDDWALFVGQ